MAPMALQNAFKTFVANCGLRSKTLSKGIPTTLSTSSWTVPKALGSLGRAKNWQTSKTGPPWSALPCYHLKAAVR